VEPAAPGEPPRFPIDPARQTWGLGDVAVGILASMFLSLFVGGLIIEVAGWSSNGEVRVPIWGQGLLQLPLWAGYLGVALFATREKGTGPVRDLGIAARPLDAPLGLLIGVATQLLLLPLIYVPIFWLTGTDTDELSAPARELAGRADGTFGWVVFALMVGLGAPVVEELFYRGLLMRSLQKRGMQGWGAVAVAAAVFAAVHLQGLQLAGLFAFGFVAGALAYRSGRLGPAIWAHVGFNLTTVVVLYLRPESLT
jgi:membrane protease YdiL (CAAX protease family)